MWKIRDLGLGIVYSTGIVLSTGCYKELYYQQNETWVLWFIEMWCWISYTRWFLYSWGILVICNILIFLYFLFLRLLYLMHNDLLINFFEIVKHQLSCKYGKNICIIWILQGLCLSMQFFVDTFYIYVN